MYTSDEEWPWFSRRRWRDDDNGKQIDILENMPKLDFP